MPRADPPLLAPPWHTVAFVSLLLLVPLLALVSEAATPATSERLTAIYLPLIGAQAMLVSLIAIGLRLGRTPFSELLGHAPRVGDLLLGLALALAVFAAQQLWPVPTPSGLLPQTIVERLLWVVVATVVALGEELTYRGYLQRQLTALTRSPVVGVLLQALLFGLAHGERGIGPALWISLIGVGLGLSVRVRGSLWPALCCHGALDVAAGLLPQCV
jgi:hypothetical protein